MRTSLPRWVRTCGAGRHALRPPRTVLGTRTVPASAVPYLPRTMAPQRSGWLLIIPGEAPPTYAWDQNSFPHG